MSVVVRPAQADELEELRRIEVEAGRAFVDVGMPAVAADEPMPLDVMDGYRADGRLWVAAEGDLLLGYVAARHVGGRGHVEQVSVRPEAQGRGLGRILVDTVADWARAEGYTELTLSTFRDVPWNAPLYAHLGFRVLAEHELTDALLADRATEVEHGLDVTVRVFMVRDLAVGR